MIAKKLVSLLSSESDGTRRRCAHMLSSLAQSIPGSHVRIVNAGAISPLVAILTSSSREAQESAISALSGLAADEPSNQLAIATGLVKLLGIEKEEAQTKLEQIQAKIAAAPEFRSGLASVVESWPAEKAAAQAARAKAEKVLRKLKAAKAAAAKKEQQEKERGGAKAGAPAGAPSTARAGAFRSQAERARTARAAAKLKAPLNKKAKSSRGMVSDPARPGGGSGTPAASTPTGGTPAGGTPAASTRALSTPKSMRMDLTAVELKEEDGEEIIYSPLATPPRLPAPSPAPFRADNLAPAPAQSEMEIATEAVQAAGAWLGEAFTQAATRIESAIRGRFARVESKHKIDMAAAAAASAAAAAAVEVEAAAAQEAVEKKEAGAAAEAAAVVQEAAEKEEAQQVLQTEAERPAVEGDAEKLAEQTTEHAVQQVADITTVEKAAEEAPAAKTPAEAPAANAEEESAQLKEAEKMAVQPTETGSVDVVDRQQAESGAEVMAEKEAKKEAENKEVAPE